MRAQYELRLRESRQPSGEIDLADLAAIGTAVEADAPPPDAPLELHGIEESHDASISATHRLEQVVSASVIMPPPW